MDFLERFWKRMSGAEAAEKAELEGNLPDAIRLWVANGAVDEAARVMLLRGDAEPEPKVRLQHYTQAVATASAGSLTHKAARAKKARLTVTLAEGATLSTALRRDVIEAAAELEQVGESTAAAEAYALAGDTEGEARALTQAGDVERLEAVLSRAQAAAKEARISKDVHSEVDALISAGQRRKALAIAESAPDDPLARSRVARLRGARIGGPVVRLTLRGQHLYVVVGGEVVIGRTEGAITVPSGALSRKHLQISRDPGTHRFVLKDLGSRNGTQLRGLNLVHPLEVVGDMTVTLGGEVPVRLTESPEIPSALAIEVAGTRYLALLRQSGDTEEDALGIPGWGLRMAPDGWVELEATRGAGAFAGHLALVSPVTLLRGDSLSSERAGDVVLRIDE